MTSPAAEQEQPPATHPIEVVVVSPADPHTNQVRRVLETHLMALAAGALALRALARRAGYPMSRRSALLVTWQASTVYHAVAAPPRLPAGRGPRLSEWAAAKRERRQ